MLAEQHVRAVNVSNKAKIKAKSCKIVVRFVVILMNSLWRNFKTTINLHMKISADSSDISRQLLHICKMSVDYLQIFYR